MHRAGLAIVLLAAACGGSGDAGTTSTAHPASAIADTTTTLARTTTTVPEGPIEIPPDGERTLVWVPGTMYTAPGFWVPVSFTVAEEGWQSLGARELWVYARYLPPGRATLHLDLAVVAHSPRSGIEQVASGIAASPEVEVIAEPAPTTLDGYEARVLDVRAPPSGIGGGYCGNNSLGNSRYQHNETGLRLLADVEAAYFAFAFGVRSCRAARIWVVDVDGNAITIIAAATRPDVFDEHVPVVDRFLEGISFEG